MQKEKLIEIAHEFNTPVYVYDGNKVKEKYNELINSIPYERLKIFYAMKANYNPKILEILKNEGACIDAVSPGDVLLALKVGFDKERILFTANRMTEEEMHLVKEKDILFNIGSLVELEMFGKSYPGSEVCLRFNPMVEAGENDFVKTGGENSKFGILLSNKNKALEIVKKYELKIVGIHKHTGSGIPEATKLMQGVKNILNILNKEDFPNLKFLDFGGGFKVSYKEGEEIFDIKTFGIQITEMFQNFCSEFGKELELYFEPGKFLVSESGHFLVKVVDIKQNPKKILAGVNAGFPQLIRPMFYSAYHKILNLNNPEGEKETYDIVGNICESGDCFAIDRELPKIKVGDLLSIENAGAYCFAMGGEYNLRPMPPEVLFLDGKYSIARKSQSFEELADKVFSESH